MKINNFQGDLTDNSAKKEALQTSVHVCYEKWLLYDQVSRTDSM